MRCALKEANMEALANFLQEHGLSTLALAAAWGLLKYYIGKDIQETRAGIQASHALHKNLKDYVETCEEELRGRLAAYDKEIAMIKQEANHLSTDIRASLSRVENNLADHTKREEIYQRHVTDFMGYVYRHLGNGKAPSLTERDSGS